MSKCLWGEEEVRKAERGTRNREGLFFGGPTKEGSGLWTGGPFQGRSSDGSRFWFVTGEDFTRLGRVLLRPSLSKHVTWLGPGSVVLLAGKHIQGVTWRDGWNQSLPDGVEAVSMKGSELSAAEAHPAAKVSEDEGEGEEEEEGEEQEGGEGVALVPGVVVDDKGRVVGRVFPPPVVGRQQPPPKQPKQPRQQRGLLPLGRARTQPPTQQPPTPTQQPPTTPPPLMLATQAQLAHSANTANDCPGLPQFLPQFVASLQLYHGGAAEVEQANQNLSKRCHALHDPNPNPP